MPPLLVQNCRSLGTMKEPSIPLPQTSLHCTFPQPAHTQAATPATAKSTCTEQPADQALTQPPTFFKEAELLAATVFPVAVLLPSFVLCPNDVVVTLAPALVVVVPAAVVALPVVFCRSKYPPASGCPNPAAATKPVRLNGYRFVRFDRCSGR